LISIIVEKHDQLNLESGCNIWDLDPSSQSSPAVYPAVVTTVGSIHGWERKSKINVIKKSQPLDHRMRDGSTELCRRWS